MSPVAELEFADAGVLLNAAFTSVSTMSPHTGSGLSFDERLNVGAAAGLAVEHSDAGPPAAGEISALVTGPDGRKLTELPLVIVTRDVTGSDLSIGATDPSGSLLVTIGVDRSGTGTVNLVWTPHEHTLPGAVVPAIAMLRNFSPPNRFSMLYQGLEMMPAQSIPPGADLVPAEIIDLVEKLDFVQRCTGTYFFVPSEFSGTDIESLTRAEQLLKGEQVLAEWNSMSVRLAVHEEFRPADMGDNFAFILEADESVVIAGHQVLLGRSRRHLLSARVSEWHEGETKGTGLLRLTPGDHREFETWLPAMGRSEYMPVPGISAAFRSSLDEFIAENDEVLRRLAQ